MSWKLYTGFVSAQECTAIADYTRAVRDHLRPNRISPHRYFSSLTELPDLPREINEIEHRVWDETGFGAAERDTFVPHYLSLNEPGGAIHLHTDPGVPDCNLNTRFNVMINKPTGGEPVIDGAAVPAGNGDAWCFIASRHKHRSLPVVDGWRIVVGYGFQIPRDDQRLVRLGLE